jgi:hypothetical protein
MAQDHTLMASRFELKYLIPEHTALKVREFVQQYLQLDDFGFGKPNLSYPVHSLYLDSDDYELHRRTVNGDKNRYKLRVRYYNENPNTPVFFEIKKRMKDIILKERGTVRRSGVAKILSGFLPEDGDMKGNNPEERQAILRFIQLMADVNAKPKMHVAYDREAYVNNFNNEVRVTMDRNVRGMFRPSGELVTDMPEAVICTTDMVILELKFTGRFPAWYRDLVRHFNCMQTGAAKYLETVALFRAKKTHQHPRDVIRGMVW